MPCGIFMAFFVKLSGKDCDNESPKKGIIFFFLIVENFVTLLRTFLAGYFPSHFNVKYSVPRQAGYVQNHIDFTDSSANGDLKG